MITALFNYAVDYFNLAENPCHKAGRMGKREVVVNFWTKEEFDRILAAMENDPTAHVSFSLLYYSGIRFGEFLALTPKDFDFKKNTLDITKNLQRINKQGCGHTTRNELSRTFYQKISNSIICCTMLVVYVIWLYN